MRCVFLISDHAAQSIGKRAAPQWEQAEAGGVSHVHIYRAPSREGGRTQVSAIRLAHCLQMIANFPVASPQILARKVSCLCRCSCLCLGYSSGLATCATFFAFLTPPPPPSPSRLIGQQLIPVFSAKFSRFSARSTQF